MKYRHGGETDMENTTAPATPDYGEYGDVIETIKKFTAFLTELIKKIMDFFNGLIKKDDPATPEEPKA